MRKFFLLSVTAILICSISYAKIWRVNNNAGVVADFTTAQQAHDNGSVNPGDTIHIEPSLTNYGNLNCSKRLVWISTGAFLNAHPNEQFSPNVGKINNLAVLLAGSENSIFHLYMAGYVNIGTTGVKMDRCYVEIAIDIGFYAPITAANDISITNSFCKGFLTVSGCNNNLITNNIFLGSLTVSSASTFSVITHNVFNGLSSTVASINNAIVENNIFSKATSPIIFNNSTVQYNMSGAAAVLPAGNNNQNNIPMSTVFVNNNGLDDASFVLKPGSPAIAAGSIGVDLGAYGGSTPFKPGLQPAIPAIYNIQLPAAAPAGNTMNVTFSTKSNN